jgi:hypothetical protein
MLPAQPIELELELIQTQMAQKPMLLSARPIGRPRRCRQKFPVGGASFGAANLEDALAATINALEESKGALA